VATKTQTTLIPRKLFFSNPDKAMLRLSPDGKHLTYLANLDGVLNIWLASRDDIANAKVITQDKGRGIQFYMWAYTNKHVLYIQDKDGDENWHLYSVNVDTLETKDLTPFENVHTQLLNVNHNFPEHVVIGLNNRDPQWHDIYKINIATGEMELLEQHDCFSSFLVDEKQTIRFAFASTPEGNREMFIKNTGSNKNIGWELWDTIPQEDALTTYHFNFDKSGEHLFLSDSRGRNTSALFRQNATTKEKTLLAENPKADLSNTLIHPVNKNVQAASFNYERETWQVLDKEIQADFDYLRTVADGDLMILDRTLEDDFWIVGYMKDNGPFQYYLYERSKRQATFLFTNRKELENIPLSNMHPFVIKARDGLELVGYYSLPLGSDSKTKGIPDKPLPMVFTPHGGPWWRDSWGFNPWHLWLTNRGYAVMTINFRASTGFGKALTNAGDLEWGGKIIEDQVEAVQWCIEKGIADKHKIAIMGGSFGGFSVLAGLTFYPDLYACGVDLVGVSNLMTFMETIPPYWKTEMELLYKRVGDPRSEEGKALLKKHSPVNYIERISKPLLIAQGANDPRVNKDESDQVANAMKAKNIPVTYLLYPDEGHGMARPENGLSFYALAEAFLAKYLGGESEGIGDDLQGSSMQVLEGTKAIPGLQPLQAA
jgi:dipeptidyl aminopeptidase/acylaminoacyl peptidase